MEYRGWITVPSLNVESDDAERLIVALEKDHGDLGPVLSGELGGCNVVLSTSADHRVTAAERMYDAVAGGLRSAGLSGLYPAGVEVEPADDLIPA